MYTVSLTMLRIYGFYDECKRRYSIKLWKTFTDCFNCLPLGTSLPITQRLWNLLLVNFLFVVAMVEDNILCMHGGISPDLKSLDQVCVFAVLIFSYTFASVSLTSNSQCYNVMILFDSYIKPANWETICTQDAVLMQFQFFFVFFFVTQLREIERPLDVPDRGLVCDILWSDPDEVSV